MNRKLVIFISACRSELMRSQLIGEVAAAHADALIIGDVDDWRDLTPEDLLRGEIGTLDCGFHFIKAQECNLPAEPVKSRGPLRSRNARRVW